MEATPPSCSLVPYGFVAVVVVFFMGATHLFCSCSFELS